MNFIWPQALSLLILVPLYVLLHFYFERKKKKDIIPFGNLEILIEAIAKTKRIDILKHLPLILKTTLLILLIIALARPVSIIQVPVRDTKVMLLMDISISMEAQDIKPNRILAAREAAKQFIQNLPKGIQIGIGVFSGSTRILANPSLDKLKILKFLNKLDTNTLEPGTAIGDAILAGTDSLTYDDTFRDKYSDNRIIVLITDGEANVGNDPFFSATQAKVNNVIIQAIGIGSPTGTIIRGGILTRLDEFTLQEITSLTGGHYYNALNARDMNKIYRKIKKTIKLVPQETEITFIPVIGILFLLVTLQYLRWSKFRFI